MTEDIKEYDAIVGVLGRYMDGAATGDVALLKEAFHEDARMYGELAGTRYDVSITEFFEIAQAAPAGPDTYRSRVMSVHRIGDAATAVVAEDGYWGTVSFVDFFTLNRIDGSWKIVNKSFVHTGGEPPAH